MKLVPTSCVFVICLFLSFLIGWLPFLKSAKAIGIITRNSIKTIRSAHLADAEKEKRLLTNSWQIFWRSFYILGLTLLVLSAGYLLIILIDVFGIYDRPAIVTYLETGRGLLISLVAFLTYFLCRKLYVRFRL